MKRRIGYKLLLMGIMIYSTAGWADQARAGAASSEVCSVIEKYVAGMDAVRSIREKNRRADFYVLGKDKISPILQRHGETSLLANLLEYADLTEQIVTSDATDPNFDLLLGKRLRLRSQVLERCEGYTEQR